MGVFSRFALAAAAAQVCLGVCLGLSSLCSRLTLGRASRSLAPAVFAARSLSALPLQSRFAPTVASPMSSCRFGRLALASRGPEKKCPSSVCRARSLGAAHRAVLALSFPLRPLPRALLAPVRFAPSRRRRSPLTRVSPPRSAPFVLVARARLRASLRSAPCVRLAPLRSAPLSSVAPPLALLGRATRGLRPLRRRPRSSRPPVRCPRGAARRCASRRPPPFVVVGLGGRGSLRSPRLFRHLGARLAALARGFLYAVYCSRSDTRALRTNHRLTPD